MKKCKISKNLFEKLSNESKSSLSKGFKGRHVDFAKSYFRKFSNFEVPLQSCSFGLGWSVMVGGAFMLTCKAEEEKEEELPVGDMELKTGDVLTEEGINKNKERLKIRNEQLKSLLLNQFTEDSELAWCSFFLDLFLASLSVEIEVHKDLSEEEIYSRIMEDPLYGKVAGVYDNLFENSNFLAGLREHIAQVKNPGDQ